MRINPVDFEMRVVRRLTMAAGLACFLIVAAMLFGCAKREPPRYLDLTFTMPAPISAEEAAAEGPPDPHRGWPALWSRDVQRVDIPCHIFLCLPKKHGRCTCYIPGT